LTERNSKKDDKNTYSQYEYLYNFCLPVINLHVIFIHVLKHLLKT